MTTYYNENNPDAAAWLRNLITNGAIPRGDVDERSVVNVQPGDLRGYRQVHLFAGIGGWAYASRLAGWPEGRELWTGSCPCQPFSVAGRGRGTADARHLWPYFYRLLRACRPAVLMGEQVAGKAGRNWLDGVCADLEGDSYACRAVDIPACAVNAPHIRNRLYWVARRLGDPNGAGSQIARGERGDAREEQPATERADGRMGDGDAVRQLQQVGREREQRRWTGDTNGGMDNADRGYGGEDVCAGRHALAGANGNFWSNAQWIVCADGKARRAEPGSPLLVAGVSGRVAVSGAGKVGVEAGQAACWINRGIAWRGFGNAIVPQLAAHVIAAYMETE